uniref:U3 small nucleolar RNA-interacting protein 2 n=1 Tax=Lygus hesperus TaxID=30085 RepID=A0A0A9WM40_LYGHE
MSSFFIRPKTNKNVTSKKEAPQRKLGKRSLKKSKGKVYDSKVKKRKFDRPKDDEEITSDEDILDEEGQNAAVVESDEDEHLTPQEKKLQLAKKYLEEIEEEEKKKADGADIDDGVILGRLREDVLRREGKLKKRVADNIITSYEDSDITVLKCKEHKLAITCLAVSSDDKLFTGSKDASIVKWCLSTMRKVGFIPPRHKDKSNENSHATSILCMAISHDDRYLAVGDESNLIQIWDPKTLEHVFTFKGHRGAVTGLSFCRLTHHLYSASHDKTVKVWSMPERAYIETLFGHQAPISALDVLAKDRVVTSGGSDTSVRVWKIEEESQLIFNGHKQSIDSIRKLSDVHFISCGEDGLVCIWGANKKKPLHRIQNAHGVSPCSDANWIVSVACIPNTDVFATGSSDGVVRLWKCDNNYRGATVLGTVPVTGFANAMVFTHDQKRLVIGVGQEHRLGRWSRIKSAKNSVLVVRVQKPEEQPESSTRNEVKKLLNGSAETDSDSS